MGDRFTLATSEKSGVVLRCHILNGPYSVCLLYFPIYLTSLQDSITLSYMKTSSLTIRLDKDLDKLLNKASRLSGKSRSEVARDALRRQLRLIQFEALRKKVMPFAEARGYLTDEDVFRDVS